MDKVNNRFAGLEQSLIPTLDIVRIGGIPAFNHHIGLSVCTTTLTPRIMVLHAAICKGVNGTNIFLTGHLTREF